MLGRVQEDSTRLLPFHRVWSSLSTSSLQASGGPLYLVSLAWLKYFEKGLLTLEGPLHVIFDGELSSQGTMEQTTSLLFMQFLSYKRLWQNIQENLKIMP
jgi:hypothetical protein